MTQQELVDILTQYGWKLDSTEHHPITLLTRLQDTIEIEEATSFVTFQIGQAVWVSKLKDLTDSTKISDEKPKAPFIFCKGAGVALKLEKEVQDPMTQDQFLERVVPMLAPMGESVEELTKEFKRGDFYRNLLQAIEQLVDEQD